MDKKEGIKQGFVCFGAGTEGERTVKWARELGTAPLCFIDNNPQKIGTLWAGIPVKGPQALTTMPFAHILITCGRKAEIRSQLLEWDIPENKIITGSHNMLNHLLWYAASSLITDEQSPSADEKFRIGSVVHWPSFPVLYDLQNGMVLGGVETWAYGLACQLKDVGIPGLYLTTDTSGPAMPDHTYPVSVLPYKSCPKDIDRIRLCMREIESRLPCTVLCNFPQHTFWAACLMKQKHPGRIRILAVQHSDDPLYYEAYGLWNAYVDRYVSLSSRIEEGLIAAGVDKGKTIRMDWQVPCPLRLGRTWSGERELLRIGYAGRVTVTSKRADLLTELSLRLRKKGIPFVLEIAGEGDYSRALRESIGREKLKENVKLLGYIDRETLSVFWKRQDIMLSCSEREGHSLSQREAMAQGVVPVVTDVSGVQDDIKDGENGFIVDVGDLNTAAERIGYLHENRDILKQMGKAAHQSVLARQKDTDQRAFWLRLLKEAWELCK